jgi:hypothetical protein
MFKRPIGDAGVLQANNPVHDGTNALFIDQPRKFVELVTVVRDGEEHPAGAVSLSVRRPDLITWHLSSRGLIEWRYSHPFRLNIRYSPPPITTMSTALEKNPHSC